MMTLDTYTYNSTGQLTKVLKNGVRFSTFTYDADGNRLSAILDKAPVVTYTYDTQDRIATDSSGNHYSFDTDGFIQSNTSSAGLQTFNYNVLVSLRSVTMPNGDVTS